MTTVEGKERFVIGEANLLHVWSSALSKQYYQCAKDGQTDLRVLLILHKVEIFYMHLIRIMKYLGIYENCDPKEFLLLRFPKDTVHHHWWHMAWNLFFFF